MDALTPEVAPDSDSESYGGANVMVLLRFCQKNSLSI
jgi:hypothetical protein